MENRLFKGDKAGVSAVIGVILMVAITVAIAATVYVYVSGMIGDDSEPRLYIEGTVMSVEESGMYGNFTVYNITLDDGNTYPMMFRTADAVVPPTQVTLQFYYEMVGEYYDVYEIKSL